jgi:hypothetical protein
MRLLRMRLFRMRLNRRRIHLEKEGEDFKRQLAINKIPQAIFKLSS